MPPPPPPPPPRSQMFGMVVEFAVISGGTEKGKTNTESTGTKAANIMSEAVSSIRTVVS